VAQLTDEGGMVEWLPQELEWALAAIDSEL